MLLSTTRHVVAALLLAGSPSLVDTAWAQTNIVALPKLDESLTASVQKGDSDWKRVIIQTTGDEVPAMAALLYMKGNIVGRVLPSITALTAIVPVGELEALSRLSSVKSISVDAVVTADQTPAPGALSPHRSRFAQRWVSRSTARGLMASVSP